MLLRYWNYDDNGFLVQPVSDTELEISAIPPPTGQAGRPFRRLKQVDRELEHRVVMYVKEQITCVAEELLTDLTRRFPPEPLMKALRIVYPEFFREKPRIEDVTAALDVLERYYGTPRPAPSGTGQLTPLIDTAKLREQRAAFLLEARERAELLSEAVTRGAKYPKGLLTAFWTDLTRNPGVADSISEYGRLAQLAATIVPGSVETERVFSVMSYIKNKQRNRLLQPHLSACIRLKLQEWYRVACQLPVRSCAAALAGSGAPPAQRRLRGGGRLICARTFSSANWRYVSLCIQDVYSLYKRPTHQAHSRIVSQRCSNSFNTLLVLDDGWLEGFTEALSVCVVGDTASLEEVWLGNVWRSVCV
ncbi:hypothetical protein PLESTM_000932300 [Pleodorina starrii]|nr:hypothetical protein PLESTM_000932300 [Pleodorina starrii]